MTFNKQYIKLLKSELNIDIKVNPDISFSPINLKYKKNRPYYCIIKSLNIKVIFKKEMYDYKFKDHLEFIDEQYIFRDYENDKFKQYKLLAPEDKCEEISNNISSLSYDDYVKNFNEFFINHYNNLKGFPKILQITENFIVLEFIEGSNIDLSDVKNYDKSIFDLNLFNFRYLKNNNIFIAYNYQYGDIIINQNDEVYFVDFENFYLSVNTAWFIIDFYNNDNSYLKSNYMKNVMIEDIFNNQI